MDAYITAAADRDRHSALQHRAEHARLVRAARLVNRARKVEARRSPAQRHLIPIACSTQCRTVCRDPKRV